MTTGRIRFSETKAQTFWSVASPVITAWWCGDDLLLGGYSPYLAKRLDAAGLAARDAILATWRSAADYATKIQQLTVDGVGENNSVRFGFNSSVFDDSALDTYEGNAGIDWFLVDIQAEVGLSSGGTRDRIPSEQLFGT